MGSLPRKPWSFISSAIFLNMCWIYEATPSFHLGVSVGMSDVPETYRTVGWLVPAHPWRKCNQFAYALRVMGSDIDDGYCGTCFLYPFVVFILASVGLIEKYRCTVLLCSQLLTVRKFHRKAQHSNRGILNRRESYSIFLFIGTACFGQLPVPFF